jgi:hypothetical protein
MNTLSKNRFIMEFPKLPQPVSEFWACFVDYLAQEKILPKKFTLSQIAGHPEHLKAARGTPELVLTPSEVQAVIGERGLTGFSVSASNSDLNRRVMFGLAKVADGTANSDKWTRFGGSLSPKSKAPANWNALFEKLLSRWPSIGGWQCHIDYQTWQSVTLEESYEFGSYGPLSEKYRRYPDPLFPHRNLIDISLNPGRPRALKLDLSNCPVNFYPTAEMWLGPHFWQYAKCTKEEALAADFWLETRDTPHFTYFKCWPTAFTRPEGEQGRMQQRLWKLFFHEDCEWPPGSGTICDEPMYGPPELMPKSADGEVAPAT